MKQTILCVLFAAGLFLAATDGLCQEFYSNGIALNQWDDYPNRTFVDGDKVAHVGYYQTWHFIKGQPSDPFWFQRQVVRTYDQPNKKWFYDQTTRVWVGVWDDARKAYAKLPKARRRHLISDIPTSDFPEANVIPHLAELVPGFAGRVPPASPLMGEPPDPTSTRRVSDDAKNINDTLGPGRPERICIACRVTLSGPARCLRCR